MWVTARHRLQSPTQAASAAQPLRLSSSNTDSARMRVRRATVIAIEDRKASRDARQPRRPKRCAVLQSLGRATQNRRRFLAVGSSYMIEQKAVALQVPAARHLLTQLSQTPGVKERALLRQKYKYRYKYKIYDRQREIGPGPRTQKDYALPAMLSTASGSPAAAAAQH
jgi:hypothetical protein